MASRFANVQSAPPVEIFALNRAYKEDKDPNKVDLGIGAYRTNEGKPWVLPVVRKVEKAMAEDETLNHEYLSQLGMEEFSKLATRMLLGEDSVALKENRAFGVQTLSGTGALRLGADTLAKHVNYTTFYMSAPTWPNHRLVFMNAGFKECRTYRYWDAKTRSLDFDGMIEDMKVRIPKNSTPPRPYLGRISLKIAHMFRTNSFVLPITPPPSLRRLLCNDRDRYRWNEKSGIFQVLLKHALSGEEISYVRGQSCSCILEHQEDIKNGRPVTELAKKVLDRNYHQLWSKAKLLKCCNEYKELFV
ncbi:aspartate aminotransferase, cytoplasmic-like [Centruroides sculpturatus]|uniref:aspartate aminotransferase, cytoplasmic-like n=1 Tax=Centruroides sculpturatus TaxID=218467 RepID=UPI000C6EF17B|nr:aspartate aminotransferase, cytoplasmic-like [Centruroides sculpturatus]